MNTHVLLVVENLPGRVHGGNLVIRELTPEQKTSAKFAVNIHDFFFFGLLDYHIHVWQQQQQHIGSTLVNKCYSHMQGLDFVGFCFLFFVFVCRFI